MQAYVMNKGKHFFPNVTHNRNWQVEKEMLNIYMVNILNGLLKPFVHGTYFNL